MRPVPKKLLVAIVAACAIIAAVIILALACDRRGWKESCVSGNELFQKDQNAQTCTLLYVKAKK